MTTQPDHTLDQPPSLRQRLRTQPARLVTDATGSPLGVIVLGDGAPVYREWPGSRGLDAGTLRGILALLDDASAEPASLPRPRMRSVVTASAPVAGADEKPDQAVDQPEPGPGAAEESRVEAGEPPKPPVTPLTVAAHIRPESLAVEPPPRGATADAVVDGVTIIGRVVEIAETHGYDLQMFADAANDPERAWDGTPGTRCHLRGPVMVVVADDTGEVIAAASREVALRRSAFSIATGQPRAKSGGCGKPVPRDIDSLLARLDAHGFEVDRTRPHYSITHPDKPGLRATAPKSPSDSRSIPNTVSQIRRTFGIDIRDVPQG